MQVFEMVRDWAEEPVTVFANTLEEARQIYKRWIAAHHPDRPPQPITIYPFSAEWLGDRVVLGQAAKQGKAGIGYWRRPVGGWLIGAPGEVPLGDICEPEPRIAYYRFEAEEGEDALVFAESVEHATSLYCEQQVDRWGELPTRFSLRKMSRWDLRGELVTLRDDMEGEIAGVACQDEQGVWRILPPDWDPPLGA